MPTISINKTTINASVNCIITDDENITRSFSVFPVPNSNVKYQLIAADSEFDNNENIETTPATTLKTP